MTDFAQIDVQRRYIALSLSGPWAAEGMSTQIRCRIDFPSGYPVTGRPRFALENVSTVTEESRKKLSSEVAELAEAYLSQQRPSLEAILRYILGEQTLEEGLQWVKHHSVIEGQAFNVDDGLSSSSEEDGDDTVKYVAPETDGLGTSAPKTATDSTLYSVPLHRTCGALWTGSGRLVCFHPRKPEQEASLVNSSLGLGPRREIATKDLFEGFGRLHKAYRSEAATSTFGTLTSTDSDDDFEMSSSGSSSSSDNLAPLNHHFLPAMPWNGLLASSHQEYALDTSQKSVRDFGQPSTSAASNVDMLVSIHDFSDSLPVKKGLAKRYHVQRGLEAVIKNILVVKECGFETLVSSWQLCALLLQTQTAKATWPALSTSEETMTSSQGYLRVLAKDSVLDLSYNEGMRPQRLSSNDDDQCVGRNLNRRWLVESL